jgi:hypothetical protein
MHHLISLYLGYSVAEAALSQGTSVIIYSWEKSLSSNWRRLHAKHTSAALHPTAKLILHALDHRVEKFLTPAGWKRLSEAKGPPVSSAVVASKL